MINDDKERGFSEAFLEIRDDLYSAGSGQHPLTQFVITTSQNLLDERDTYTRDSFINAIYDSLNLDGITLSREEFSVLVEEYREYLASLQTTHDSNARTAGQPDVHPDGQPEQKTTDESSIEMVTIAMSEVNLTSVVLNRDLFGITLGRTWTGLLDDEKNNTETLAKFFRELIVQEFVNHFRNLRKNLRNAPGEDGQNEELERQNEEIERQYKELVRHYKELMEDLREAERRGVASPSNPGNGGHLIPQQHGIGQAPPPVPRKKYIRPDEECQSLYEKSDRKSDGKRNFLLDDSLGGDLALEMLLLEFSQPAQGVEVNGAAGGFTGSGNMPALPSVGSNLDSSDMQGAAGGLENDDNDLFRTPEPEVPRFRQRISDAAGAGNIRDSSGFGGSGSAFSSLPIRRARTPEPEARRVSQRTGGAAGARDASYPVGFGGSGSAFSSLLRNGNSTPPSTPRMQPSSSKGKAPLSPSKESGNPPPSPGR